MFAADAGKLWVLNGVQWTCRWIERKVEWLSAGANLGAHVSTRDSLEIV